MQDIEKLPFIGSVALGIKAILDSIKTFFKHPSLLIFFTYSSIMTQLTMFGIIWAEKTIFIFLCWASKWKYFPTSESIICKENPVSHLVSSLENIVKFRDFSTILQQFKLIIAASSWADFFNNFLIFIIFSSALFCFFLFSQYFYFYSYTAMARYLGKIEKDKEYSSIFKAINLDTTTQKKIWKWTLISSILFTFIRIAISIIFAKLPLYYMCKAYQVGYTPFTNTLQFLYTFYAAPLFAYENLSVKALFLKLFTLLKQAPLATFTAAGLLSLNLYFLPSCLLKNNTLILPQTVSSLLIYCLFILSFFIAPLCQIILYRAITNKSKVL